MKRRLMLLLTLFIIGVGMASAQTKKVTGKVIDEDGLPVIGAWVIVDGTHIGASTNTEGIYAIPNAPADTKVLRVSCVGMEPRAVSFKDGQTIVLRSNSVLDEVMVVAYGTAKRSAFTGSAATINTESIEKRQVSNITNALAGEVAGLQTLSANGQPGTSSTVRIRGIGSMNASNSPLYVVDGVPFDGDISSINSQDIESLTVLKDAASTALYGSRGANGVIMVTTKRGKHGAAKVSLDARLGVNQRATRNYDVLKNPASYMSKAYEALYNGAYYNMEAYKGDALGAWNYANRELNKYVYGNPNVNIYTTPDGEYLFGQDGKMNPNATLGYYDGEYYYTPDSWREESYEQNMRQEYNINVSGGTDKINYYLSAGYLNDNGIITKSGFERYSIRANGDYNVAKWLKVGASLSYSNVDSRYPDDQTTSSSSYNVFNFANNIAPVYPFYVRTKDENGNYNVALNSMGNVVYDYGDGNTTNYKRPWQPGAMPVGNLVYDNENYAMDIFSTNWYATITPVEGLKITGRIAADIDNTRYSLLKNVWYGQMSDLGGEIYSQASRTYGLDKQLIVSYAHTFADAHTLDIMAGYDGYEREMSNIDAIGTNLYNPVNPSVDNAIDQRNGYGSTNRYATMGYFARLNYDYKGRYYLSGSYRRDASSRFHPDNRWGNFWSASAAWVINKEGFLKNARWIDFLKVKVSYGEQGNDGILDLSGYHNYYPYQDQYKLTGANGVFSDGELYYKGNKDLTWEKSKSFNVGLDFNFWHGKLEGTVEYFSRRTKDMLYNKPVATSNGYATIPMNIGAMTNSGLEVDLHSAIFKTRDFTWKVNANATFLKNEINELHPDLKGELIDGTRIYSEGESLYRRYLVKWAGVDPETGLAQYWAKDEDGVEYKTADYSVAQSTNKCATDDMLPTVYGGFGTSVEWKGLDFSISFSYQLGGTIYDSGYQTLMHGGVSSYIGQNWHKDIMNSWTESNRYTDVPRVNTQDRYAMSTSDRFMISSDYLSLNNITLGYTLPKSVTRLGGIEKVRLYFAADNVWLWSKRDGLDPRTSYSAALASSYYSPIRSLSGGLSVTF